MTDWTRGYQVTPNPDRVTWDFHFEADEFADDVHRSTRQPMQVWRDAKGRWSVSPKDT